jgi:hypothetical protein
MKKYKIKFRYSVGFESEVIVSAENIRTAMTEADAANTRNELVFVECERHKPAISTVDLIDEKTNV